MRIIVFGGNGFIGSHLVDQLLKEGHTVRIFDHMPEPFRAPLDNVEYYTANFGDPFAMAEALEQVDIVYHLVSTTVPGTSNLDPIADIENNLVGTIRLLDQIVKANVKRFVFMSSGGTVYGNPRSLPITEDHPLSPICSYGVVKIAIEKYLHVYQHLYGLKPVVLRGSNPYGPRQGHKGVQGVISTLLNNLLNNVPTSIWGDGSVVRDYIYVSDLARLCLEAGMADNTGVYNAGSGIGYSLNDILECVGEIVGERPQIVYEASRGFDVRKVVLDISSAKKYFKWKPKIDLREGIYRTWDWIKQYHKH